MECVCENGSNEDPNKNETHNSSKQNDNVDLIVWKVWNGVHRPKNIT